MRVDVLKNPSQGFNDLENFRIVKLLQTIYALDRKLNPDILILF